MQLFRAGLQNFTICISLPTAVYLSLHQCLPVSTQSKISREIEALLGKFGREMRLEEQWELKPTLISDFFTPKQ